MFGHRCLHSDSYVVTLARIPMPTPPSNLMLEECMHAPLSHAEAVQRVSRDAHSTVSASKSWSEKSWVAHSRSTSSLAFPFSSHQVNTLSHPSLPFDQLTALSYLRLLSATALHLRTLSLE